MPAANSSCFWHNACLPVASAGGRFVPGRAGDPTARVGLLLRPGRLSGLPAAGDEGEKRGGESSCGQCAAASAESRGRGITAARPAHHRSPSRTAARRERSRCGADVISEHGLGYPCIGRLRNKGSRSGADSWCSRSRCCCSCLCYLHKLLSLASRAIWLPRQASQRFSTVP